MQSELSLHKPKIMIKNSKNLEKIEPKLHTLPDIIAFSTLNKTLDLNSLNERSLIQSIQESI